MQRSPVLAVTGSWWTLWHEWLAARSGTTRARRTRAGNAAHPPLEPAPGRYVHL
jgi:polyhydroxyalkanoate synthase subunit PhaC